MRKDITGVVPDQRLAASPAYNLLDWSRDGRYVLETRVSGDANADIWVTPVTLDGHLVPGTQSSPYLRTRFSEGGARFSPESNPRWVAYQSDETGRQEVYLQAFPQPRGAHRISTDGGAAPEWGPNGQEVFYLSGDGAIEVVSVKLGVESIEASAPRKVFPLPEGSIGFSVAPDGRRYLIRMPESTPRPLTVLVDWPAKLRD